MGTAAAFDELKAGVLRTILVRRITLGIFSAVAVVVVLTSRIGYLNPLFFSPLLWFLLTFPFKRLIARQRTERRLHWAHTGFFVVEILLITVLVHFMGGSEWIGNAFYLFTVLYANFFLPRPYGAVVTGWVVACYSGLVLGEAYGVLPHRSLFTFDGEPYKSLPYNLATILAGALGIYVVVAFTVRTFAAIYARKNRLLSIREAELAQMSRRLLSAQDEERRRIARGLHDGLIQSLAAVKLYLAPAKAQLGETTYREVTDVIDDAIRQTRTLAYTVRPPLLDDLGLVPSIERLASTVGEEGRGVGPGRRRIGASTRRGTGKPPLLRRAAGAGKRGAPRPRAARRRPAAGDRRPSPSFDRGRWNRTARRESPRARLAGDPRARRDQRRRRDDYIRPKAGDEGRGRGVRVRRIRLGIVDDHTIVREGLGRVLASESDIEIVGSCGDGSGALDLASREHPDVLLLDLALPDVDGLSLIERIAVCSPETRVLVLSMHSEPEYAAAARERGAWGLVAKSSSPETLIDGIRAVGGGARIPVEQHLTPREQEILVALARGQTNAAIASSLGIQTKTVEGYCQRLMDKLETHTRAGLIAHARRTDF